MKQNKRMFMALAAGSLIVAMAGCSKAPQEDIDAAEQALKQAQIAESDQYAQEDLQQAEDALSAAMQEVEAQNDRFALIRSYDKAREMLANAKKEADEAVTEANAAKEAARLEVEHLIGETRASIEEAKVALESAPVGKGSRAEIAAMKTELETLSGTLGDIQQAFDAGKFMDAKVKAQSLRDKAEAISLDIAQAKAKKKRA